MRELLTVMDTKYKRLEYIQSSGTQWINLGLTANQDTTIKCRVSNVNSGTQSFIGLVDTGSLIYGIGQQSENNYLYGQYHKSTSSGGRILSHIAGNDGIIRNFELRKNEFYIDNALIGSITYFTFTTTNTIKLFTLNPSSTISSIKMYNAQVLDGNMNLLRNMIPVLRKSDNEIGMLDLVEGKFYPNAGTGKFTANLDTMYAIIQGTLTVQDGRVSNFGNDTNYLTLDSFNPQNNTWKFETKFILQKISVISSIIDRNSSLRNFQIAVRDNNVLRLDLSSNGTNKDIANELEGTTVLQKDVLYFLTLEFTGSQYLLKLSTDNINWTTEIAISSSDKVYSGASQSIGHSWWEGGSQKFQGIIYLQNTFYTIGDTKYKLQAVVGYTVVGSPTITDGVVSGFSESDYLTLPNYSENIISLETVFRVNANGVSKAQNIILRQQLNNPPSVIRLTQDTVYMTFRHFENGISTATNIQTPTNSVDLNNYIYIKTIIRNGFQGIYLSDNGINYQLSVSSNFAEINFANYLRSLRIGNRGDSTNNFSGSIDLPKGYIKVNNKLWFNGLEA